MGRRWDDDTRGHGVASAKHSVPAINELAALSGVDDWVTEDPDAHLLPHLKERIANSGLVIDEVGIQADGVLRMRLKPTWRFNDVELRRAVWSILAGAVELSTFVRETQSDGVVIFDAVTGVPPGGMFATHGHTIRIEVARPE
jgi:hypothetical protein